MRPMTTGSEATRPERLSDIVMLVRYALGSYDDIGAAARNDRRSF